MDAAFFGWSGAWLDPAFREWNIIRQVEAIRVPMLLLQGEDDAYGTVEQLRVAERHARCPVETLLIPGAKHSPHIEATEATCAAVAEFARRVLFGIGGGSMSAVIDFRTEPVAVSALADVVRWRRWRIW